MPFNQTLIKSIAALALAISVSANTVHAASVEGLATLDWASLSVSTTGGMTVDVFEATGLDFSTASANFDYATDIPFGTAAATGTSSAASDGIASSSGTSGPVGVPATDVLIAWGAAIQPSPNPFDLAESDVYRLVGVASTGGAGVVSLSLDYTLEVSVAASAGLGSTVLVEANLAELLGLPSAAFVLTGTVSEQLFIAAGGADSADLISGTLTFERELADGEAFSFIAGVQARVRSTPVPLPASLLLLTPAIGMLALRGRRRR